MVGYSNVIEFFMVDVYNMLFKYYVKMLAVYKLLKNPLPLQLESVKRNGEDVTMQYLSQKRFCDTLKPDDVVHVHYTFDNKSYRYYYRKDEPIEFPPYSFERMRTVKPEKKMAALSVDDNEEVFDLVKEYAGPCENFYGKEVNLETILNMDVSGFTLIDTKGKFSQIQGSILRFNS